MSTATLDQNALSFFNVGCLKVPSEGPKTIPVPLDFTGGVTEIDIDMQNYVARNKITLIQAVYLDNSNGGSSLTVSCPNTSQSITIAPNRQGYFMFLVTNPPRISFTSQSGVFVRANLLNFPVVNTEWPCITGA